MKILLRNAVFVAPNQALHFQQRDILIEEGIITQIDTQIADKDAHCIQSKNLHVSVGWFDPHVSFGEPGYEERETMANGLEVAAHSGFTALGINPDTDPLIDTHSDVSHLYKLGATALTQLHPIGCLTTGAQGQKMASLYDMHLAGAVAFGDYKKSIQNANLLKIALEYVQSFNGLLLSHPSNMDLEQNGVVHEGEASTRHGLKGIPRIAESVQIARDLELLKYTEGRLHIPFITTKESVSLIQKAKAEGLSVSCSVGIPHLYFDEAKIENFEANYKFFPPLRTQEDKTALREGLLSGTIDMVSAMHEPMNIENKELEFEHAGPGSIGLEACFGILNNLFPVEKSIAFLTRGRRCFGLDIPQIKVGAKADLTCFDPDINYVLTKAHLRSTSKNCAYLGETLTGKVIATLNNDQIHQHDD
ncbi:MAG: dihydroorotase [Flavobacteriia bacterium]|nr:dihydroorotase [Flavobacteriia bacterium]